MPRPLTFAIPSIMNSRLILIDELSTSCSTSRCVHCQPLLIVVEGVNDVEFLVRLSRRLSSTDASIPDLQALASAGRVVFVPFGGGNPAAWSDRFAPLQCPEFHLYDRESSPETELRQAAVARVLSRPLCRAFLTGKRALENYLHPAAITAAGGGEVDFGDDDCVTSLVARSWYEPGRVWNELSWRVRSRFCQRAKRWLNTIAVDQMTAEWLNRSDPAGDIEGWFRIIAHMSCPHVQDTQC